MTATIHAPPDLSVKMESQPTDLTEKEPTEDGGKQPLQTPVTRRGPVLLVTPILLILSFMLLLDTPRQFIPQRLRRGTHRREIGVIGVRAA